MWRACQYLFLFVFLRKKCRIQFLQIHDFLVMTSDLPCIYQDDSPCLALEATVLTLPLHCLLQVCGSIENSRLDCDLISVTLDFVKSFSSFTQQHTPFFLHMDGYTFEAFRLQGNPHPVLPLMVAFMPKIEFKFCKTELKYCNWDIFSRFLH